MKLRWYLGQKLCGTPLEPVFAVLDRRIPALAVRHTSWATTLEPSFLILGAQKAGTTSLYTYLLGHPDIRGAVRKEVRFFDLNYARGWAWYLRHFPPSEPTGATVITGEASPYYLFHHAVPRRVARMLPRVKLIVLLRNPIDRAYSHYQHNLAQGQRDLRSFEEALAQEQVLDRLLPRTPARYDGMDYRQHSYLARGIYIEQLRRWLTHFPREQLLVLKSEAFFQDPATHLATVVDFLGLAPWCATGFKVHNPGAYREQRIAPGTRAFLRAFYRPYNRQLTHLLGLDVADWDEEP